MYPSTFKMAKVEKNRLKKQFPDGRRHLEETGEENQENVEIHLLFCCWAVAICFACIHGRKKIAAE